MVLRRGSAFFVLGGETCNLPAYDDSCVSTGVYSINAVCRVSIKPLASMLASFMSNIHGQPASTVDGVIAEAPSRGGLYRGAVRQWQCRVDLFYAE